MKNCKKLLSVIVTLLLAASLLTSSAFAISGEAFIATPGEVNLRDSGGFDGNVIDAAPQGATVYVLGDAGYGWYKVSYNGKTGYMASYYLLFNEIPSPENVDSVPEEAPAQDTVQQPVQEVPSQTYVAPPATGDSNATVLGSGICFRSGPSTYSSVIETLETGTPIRVNGVCGSWYECVYNGSTGYIYGDYVVLNGTSKTYTISAATVSGEDVTIYSEPQTPDTTENTVTEVTPLDPPAQAQPETPAEAPSAETPAEEAPAAPSFTHNASAAQAVVDTAMQYLGVPYVWGGTSPDVGFDCSGLVYYSYGQHGYSLNRVAQSMYYNGVDVDLNDLQPGDILLFGSSVYNIWHAALYIGGGNFIHAPYSGAVVSIQSLSSTAGMRLVAARRIV